MAGPGQKRRQEIQVVALMFFLIRSAFWLCLVILLIPGDPESGSEAPRVTLGQALSAAGATIADVSGFCGRNPEACETGGIALAMIGEKALQGAEFLITVIADKIDGEEGSAVVAAPGTLTAADLETPWQAPGSAGNGVVLTAAR
jgi:hypothetical protein